MRNDNYYRREIELLAPAGSFESMKAAVEAGADAVYMGGPKFGARAYAENPEEAGLLEAIDYIHLHGRKLFLTVNTLLKEREIETELLDYLEPLYQQGLDAVIVQDTGVMQKIRERYPDLPLHVSTQATVCSPYGAALMQEMGASRLVLPRELSLKEIGGICRSTNMEVEIFIHGALCYCYSGQCLMSSLIGGRSGNRGRCAQPCRLPYEGGHLLNLKDLCTLDILPDVLKTGAMSLKIEGRMKSPRYTAGVVSVYRKYLDRLLTQGPEGYKVDAADKELLRQLFDRGGWTDGYMKDHKGKDMIYTGEKPAMRRVDEEKMQEIDRKYLQSERQETAQAAVWIEAGEPVRMEAVSGNCRVSVTGEPADTAASRPLAEADVRKQMSKTGGTPFCFDRIDMHLGENCFVPVGVMNRLRRELLEKLQTEVTRQYHRTASAEPEQLDSMPKIVGEGSRKSAPDLYVSVETQEQYRMVLNRSEVKGIYLSADRFPISRMAEYVKEIHNSGKKCYYSLPYIFRSRTGDYFRQESKALQESGVDGYLVRSSDEAGFLREMDLPGERIFDAGVYGWNKEALGIHKKWQADIWTVPFEMNRGEWRDLQSEAGWAEMIVYGRIPMMVSEQCVRKTRGMCLKETVSGKGKKAEEMVYLKDRRQNRMPVDCRCRFCYNVIYNSVPLWLLDQQSDFPDRIRVSLTDETAEEGKKILDLLTEAPAGRAPSEENSFTRGHWKRGVQ